MKTNNHLQWLIDNQRFIKIRAVEIYLDMPEGTLKKFVDGKRDLPKNWQDNVAEWVKLFRK